MDIKIDDNVPIPSVMSGKRHPATEAADSLNIGQSFVWPNDDNTSSHVLKNRIRGMLSRLAPKRFTSRSEAPGIVRVWRVADATPAAPASV